MKVGRRLLGVLAVSLVLACAAASPGGLGISRNWRQEYADFLNLPADTRERVRKLDRDLQEEDPARQAALFRVMQRYADWLERLPPEQRRQIEQADSRAEKLQLIRDIREEQWVGTLPKADRDEIKSAKTPEERRKKIAAARDKKYSREMDWLFAQARVGEPPEQLLDEIRKLRTQLETKKLSREESQELKQLQNRGPAYLKRLVELGQRHDVPISDAFKKMWAEQEANPPVGRPKLLQFFMTTLSDSERRMFDVRFRDPEQREQARQDLEKRYWQEHPDELARLRESARKKREKSRATRP